MHAHTKSLPSGQAIFKKMYTFAGIRKSNKHPLQFHQDKEQRGNRRTKENRKNIKIKEFIETRKMFS